MLNKTGQALRQQCQICSLCGTKPLMILPQSKTHLKRETLQKDMRDRAVLETRTKNGPEPRIKAFKWKQKQQHGVDCRAETALTTFAPYR